MPDDRPPETGPDPRETTRHLLARARAGDEQSLEVLFARCVPALRRWARGRLPQFARDGSDTEDIVQETVLHTLHRLPSFQPRHQGALQAYLRQAIVNRIRDEIRRVQRRPMVAEVGDSRPDLAPSPLEQAIGREGVERYEAALRRLKAADREAIVARVEMQQSYEEIAIALAKPSANAARVAVTRAIARLVKELQNAR